jgi:hypothetical protein
MATGTFKPFVKIEKSNYNETEKRDVESYGDITLRFGQYKDCRIKDIIEGDAEYAKWLWETNISKNDYDSPTTRAIKKFFQYKLKL